MANRLTLKRSSVAAKVPLATDLEPGELAVNLADQKLYSKRSDGTVILVGTGGAGAGDVLGPASSTDNGIARFDGTTGKLIQNSTGVKILDDNQLYISNSLSGQWNSRTILLEDNSATGQPAIGFRAPNQLAAGILKFYGPTNTFEMRNNVDTDFRQLHGSSLPIESTVASGGDESDINTSYQVRLTYSWVHNAPRKGRVFAAGKASISRSSGGACDFLMYLRLWNVSTNSLVCDGPESGVTDSGQFGLGFNQFFSSFLEYGAALNEGQTYQMQLLLRKTRLEGPYYPRLMNIQIQFA